MKKISFNEFEKLFYYTKETNSIKNVFLKLYIYNMEDEYFNSIEKFLRTGEQTEIKCGDKSTTTIMKNKFMVYIDAVIILYSYKITGDEPLELWRPYFIE